MGDLARPQARKLAALLGDADTDVRGAAAASLGELIESAAPFAAEVCERLNAGVDTTVRERAGAAFVELATLLTKPEPPTSSSAAQPATVDSGSPNAPGTTEPGDAKARGAPADPAVQLAPKAAAADPAA